MGALKLCFCFLLIQTYTVTIESFPRPNLEGFHDLHETDASYDLNEEESKILSTAIPPPENILLFQGPEESRTEETTIQKPENETESYEATTEPLLIIHQRYQIQVAEKKSVTKRNNDERGGKLNHPEADEDESTPAYGVLENASVSSSTLDEDRKNSSGIFFQNCGHEVMETEKPILKHSELEDGVLHEAKRNPLPDFEESTLKDLEDQTHTTLSDSHETNAVQLKDAFPTEAYTAQETQILVEDKQQLETGEKDEMKAGTDLAIVIQPPSLIGGHLNQSTGTTRVNRGELTATEAPVEAEVSAEAKSEESEATDIRSTTDEPTLNSNDEPVIINDEPHKEFEDEPAPVDEESSEIDGMKDAEVESLVKHGATYYFRSAVEDVCLTAHKHKFMNIGINPGAVTAEEFERADNQLWDLLKTKANEFWLVNHQYGLSEVSVVKTATPFPSKNFLNLEPTHDGQFLMKSMMKGECIQFEGKHEKITFAPCNATLSSQHWTAEFLYEEEKL